jgi:MFS family permease
MGLISGYLTDDQGRKWWALGALSLVTLMIVFDGTAVIVALPPIKAEMGFSDTSLVWVVNAYLLTYAGFLLLSGRLGDLFGHRRLLLLGIIIFGAASLGCALANSKGQLVGARLAQGLAGAIVVTTALSLIMNIFRETGERAKALGVYCFVCAGGGTAALLVNGILTSMLGWRSIFLADVLIGAIGYPLCAVLLPKERAPESTRDLDLAGAVTMIGALTLAVYAIVNLNEDGWSSLRTFALLLTSVLLLVLFLAIEGHVRTPLIPLSAFRRRNLVVCGVANALCSIAASTAIFVSLYLQLVLGSSPLQVGLDFIPSNLLAATFSFGFSAMAITRFGVKRPLAFGLLAIALGSMFLVRVPVAGSVTFDVLPALALIGIGSGVATNPMLVAAMRGVAPGDSGFASGFIGTSSTLGGTLGFAVLGCIASAKTQQLLTSGIALPTALNAGYHLVFLISALSAGAAAAIVVLFLGRSGRCPSQCDEATVSSHP